MNERAKPYIGVSGVGSIDTQQKIIEQFDRAGLREHRQLMLGVKVLHKCQWLDQPWKRDDDWDLVGETACREVLVRDKRAVNVAQAYFDKQLVGERTYRDAFLERIYDRGAQWIDGIQFDMLPWHENTDMLTFLHETKERHPGTRIYLQCHELSMQRYSPRQLTQVLGAHADALDHLLLDSSHGKGVRLDADRLVPYIETILSSDTLSRVGVGFAGGLDGSAIREDLPALIAKYPELSWDAEGRLHPRREDGRMPLDIPTVADYFRASAEVIG